MALDPGVAYHVRLSRTPLGTAIAGKADVLCTRDLDLCDERVRAFAAEHGIRIMGDLELLAVLDALPPA